MTIRAVLLLAFVCGCARPTPPRLERQPPWPDVRTTAPELALRNLDAGIEGAAQAHERHPGDAFAAERLARLLLLRGTSLQRDADLESGLEVMRSVEPTARVQLMRARLQLALHDAAHAQQSVQAAAAKDPLTPELAEVRARLHLARGLLPEALGAILARNQRGATATTLTLEAIIRSRLGEHRESAALYRAAMRMVREPSPFVVSWIESESANALARRGDVERARARRLTAARRLSTEPSLARVDRK